jgi:hypothetical protein
MAGVTVKAVHKKLRSENALGQTTTDKDGAYQIKYAVPDGETQVDLLVRAFGQTDEQLAVSKLICDAEKEETVDLTVGGDTYVGPSEYEQLVDAVTPKLDGAAVDTLTSADVQVLACKTELEALSIAYYVVAKRNEISTGVTAAAFYGFSRMRLPTTSPSPCLTPTR